MDEFEVMPRRDETGLCPSTRFGISALLEFQGGQCGLMSSVSRPVSVQGIEGGEGFIPDMSGKITVAH